MNNDLSPEKSPPTPDDQDKSVADEFYNHALTYLEEGSHSLALPVAEKALALDELNSSYISAVAQSMMPGKGYKYVLRMIHQECKPCTYLEIGVSKGRSMSLAHRNTSAVGVDPAFQIASEISAEARLFPVTSDAFFDRYNLFEELRLERLDLVFIDGLHIFEQVYKDLINVEKCACKDTIVLIHDCYPVSELTAARTRETNFWTGDVWKIIPCLIEERPDLNVNVIPCPPSGLAVISGFDPKRAETEHSLDSIISKYQGINFSHIPQDRKTYFNTVDNEWDSISKLLRQFREYE